MSTADVTNDEIAEQLAKHDVRMTRIADSVDRIEKDLEPMTLVYSDIAAVGRVGRVICSTIKWFAGVGLAVAGIWAVIKGMKP